MSADPAYQAWRGQKLWEAMMHPTAPDAVAEAACAARLIDRTAAEIIKPTRR